MHQSRVAFLIVSLTLLAAIVAPIPARAAGCAMTDAKACALMYKWLEAKVRMDNLPSGATGADARRARQTLDSRWYTFVTYLNENNIMAPDLKKAEADFADLQADDRWSTGDATMAEVEISGRFMRKYWSFSAIHKGWRHPDSTIGPWAGLLVVVTSGDGVRVTTLTDGNGNFRVSVPQPGSYQVEVEDCAIFHSWKWPVRAPGTLGTLELIDDRKQYYLIKRVDFHYFMQAIGRAPEPSTDINVLIQNLEQNEHFVVTFNRYMDESAKQTEEHKRLFSQWVNKRWQNVSCPDQPREAGRDGLIKALRKNQAIVSAPGSTPLIEMDKNVLKVDGPGTWALSVDGTTKILTNTASTFVLKSTVLLRDDGNQTAVYVLEGLVSAWNPPMDRLLAIAWADQKIVCQAGASTPSMEPFTWDEVDRLWRQAGAASTWHQEAIDPGGHGENDVGPTPSEPLHGSLQKTKRPERLIFSDSFSGDVAIVPTNWQVDMYQIELVDGKLLFEPDEGNEAWAIRLKKKIPLKNVSVEFDGMTEGDSLAIVFSDGGGKSFSSSFGATEWSGTSLFEGNTAISSVRGPAIRTDVWSHFKISQNDGSVELEIDGRMIITGRAPEWMRGEGYVSIASQGWPIMIDNVTVRERQ